MFTLCVQRVLSIAVYRPTTNKAGMSTKSVLGFLKTIKTVFDKIKCLLLEKKKSENENHLISSIPTKIEQI